LPVAGGFFYWIRASVSESLQLHENRWYQKEEPENKKQYNEWQYPSEPFFVGYPGHAQHAKENT